LEPEADVRSEVREVMALALGSTVNGSVLRAVVSASTEALRSLASPMSAAPDVTDDVEDADGAVVVYCGEDRRDRDTKLSRVLNPLTVGPRLRSS
jgi:hypothetical protein